MRNSFRISIVMPSFNQAEFLEEALLSVLDQDYRDVELIAIDGGSSDDSPRILERHGPRLKYWVSEPDSGQVDAINRGLAQATGEIVAFLNSDDLYLPGALTRVANHFTRHPGSRWLAGDGYVLDSPHRRRELIDVQPPVSVAAAIFFNYRLIQPSVFWRREVFGKYGTFDPRYAFCFDHEFYVRLLAAGESCDHLPIPLSCFRLHVTSKTMSQGERFEPEVRQIRRQYLRHLRGLAAVSEALSFGRREAGRRLVEADVRWVAGDRRGGLRTGLAALLLSPPVVLRLVARRLGRVIFGLRPKPLP